MSKHSTRYLNPALCGLAALSTLLVSSVASAGRIEGFRSRAGFFSDQACVANYYTGVTNSCPRNILVQVVATVAASGNYYPNAFAFADDHSSFQPFGVNNNLDTVWSPGSHSHADDFYGDEMWGSYPSPNPTYVPASGALIFMVWLPENQRLAYYSF